MDPDVYGEQRYKDGLEYAKTATQYDQQGHYSAALTFYSEAAEALHQACQMAPFFSPILPRVEEYSKRAQEIRRYLMKRSENPVKHESTDRDKHIMHQLEYLMEVGMLFDEEKRYKEAEKTYTSAIDMALKAQKILANDDDKSKLKRLALQALERLEDIKKLRESVPQKTKDSFKLDLPDPPKGVPKLDSDDDEDEQEEKKDKRVKKRPMSQPQLPKMPLVSFLDADPDKVARFNAWGGEDPHGGAHHSSSQSPAGGRKSNSNKFTDKELKILKTTSKINGVVYYPWSDLDLSELRTVSALPMDFCDPDGLIKLSEKQKSRLAGWMRPGEICENPKMAHLISSFSIKQTLIGDCSFVASLGVCADYERRFKTRLITRCIYPRNRLGEPIINPNGKYFVSLHLNGLRRKVVIDDRLPVSAHGNLLCSYSNVKDEFWVSLLEKAYLKVMGGYDFPGSSSNNDLHALTGWIPERIDIKECDKDKTFKMMERKAKEGSALITMGTGPLTEIESEKAGLAPTHAYAVLQVISIQGLKLLQLKNPWSEKRWKGNFSENDTVHWTPELQKALNYDRSLALQVDNGVFWIDWTAVCRFYETLYINWKPDIFRFKYTYHDFWKPGMVEKDLYNISNNPQYTLRINCTEQNCTVWLLLSRHITTKSDFANNEKFITLHIASSNGKRLYLPPREYVHQGIKINTPHYLAKLNGIPRGSHTYTVIVSQLDSLSTIYYTMKIYSTSEFSFHPVPNIYQHTKELKGQWITGRSKPTFKITLPSPSSVLLQLKGPRKYFVWVAIRSSSGDLGGLQRDSGPAKPGFTVLEVPNVPTGEYVITPATYGDNQEGPFFLTASSDNVFNFETVHS